MKKLFLLNFLLFLLFNKFQCRKYCDLYLSQSNLKGLDRGVFTGRNYLISNIINTLPSIIIQFNLIKKFQLVNYVFSSSNNNYVIGIFGIGMLFNHRNNKNIIHLYNSNPPLSSDILSLIFSQPYTTYPMLDFVAEQNIIQYDEIFTSYGEGNSWFAPRNITLLDPEEIISTTSTFEELDEYGHCLTDIYVNTSNIPLSGKGLFAKRSFRKGEIVDISPILFFSKHALHKLDDTSTLTNYAICSLISDVCILPIGLGAIANHGGIESNVEIEWYNWKTKPTNSSSASSSSHSINSDNSPTQTPSSLPEKLSWSVKDLATYPAAPLDIVYRATKDLNEGDEILMFYGEEWEKEWLLYMESLKKWNEEYDLEVVKNYQKPQFRHPIVEPKNFFPSHFQSVSCIDPSGCGNKKYNRRKRQTELKEIKESLQYINKYFQK